MLRPDVIMAEVACLIDGQLNSPPGSRRKAGLSGTGLITTPDNELHRSTYFTQAHAQISQDLSGYPLLLTHQTKQDMLSANIAVIKALGLFLSQGKDPTSSL